MGIKYSNNAEGQLNAILLVGGTSLTLLATEGDHFPTVVAASGDHFYCTLVNQAGAMEIIKVTEHQNGTDVFQVIERAADSIRNETPTALEFQAND
ncbi:unnamed protein product, partial [marine sediment metagenome]